MQEPSAAICEGCGLSLPRDCEHPECPERVRAQPAPTSRYEKIRSYIATAKRRNGELPVEPYLLAQIALLLCDIHAAVELQNSYLHEIAVHK